MLFSKFKEQYAIKSVSNITEESVYESSDDSSDEFEGSIYTEKSTVLKGTNNDGEGNAKYHERKPQYQDEECKYCGNYHKEGYICKGNIGKG